MGFLSWLWNWIKSLFGFGESREDEVEDEEEDVVSLIKDSKITKKLEKDENKQLKKIIRRLLGIFNYLYKNKLSYQIKYMGRSIEIKRAIYALMKELQRLINTGTSIKQEEEDLKRIKGHWIVVSYGLVNLRQFSKDVNEINLLFKKLGADLNKEDKIDEDKVRLIKEAYAKIKAEKGGKTNPPK